MTNSCFYLIYYYPSRLITKSAPLSISRALDGDWDAREMPQAPAADESPDDTTDTWRECV